MSVTTRTNLCTNPSFETGTGGWAAAGTGATIATSTAQHSTGTQSLLLTMSTAGITTDGCAARFTLNATSGTTYTMTVNVFCPSGTVWLNLAGTHSPATTLAGQWQQLSVTWTAASTASVTADISNNAATTAGQQVYIDSVLIEAASTAGTYFDGSYTNAGGVVYAWTGTAGASTSTATTYVPVIALSTGYSPCPNVQVTITDMPPTANTVTVWRTADGQRAAVRTTKGMTVTTSTAVTDWEAPQGRDVAYDLEVSAGTARGAVAGTAHTTLAARTDAAGKPTWWIQDPLVPGTAVELAVTRGDGSKPYLTAAAVKALEYTADVSIVPIIGSDRPIAIGGQRMAAAGVDFSMFTSTAQATTNLRNLLRSSATLLVRPPGTGREAGLPGLVYTGVAKPVEQPVTVAFGGTLTRWAITADTVAPPTAAILVPVWTYQSVNALWSTYQQAQTALAAKTYLDVLKSPSGA